VATAIADRVVGIALSTAASMALYHREKTGRGQAVQVPMFETFAHFVMGDHLYGHSFVPPIGDWGYARMMSGERRPYRTKDGYVGVQVYNDKHWRRFFEVTGHVEMARDPRYADIAGRTQHIADLYEFLARTFETRPTAEWIALLTEADIPIIEEHARDAARRSAHARRRLLPGGGAPQRRPDPQHRYRAGLERVRKRAGQPEDVADAVAFLASERAGFISGEVLHVSGGRYG
jgi:formyl-CoA transferase